MLFIAYWELNPDIDPVKIAKRVAEIVEKGLWPPKGAKVLGWYFTPEHWGISIMEYENAETAMESFNTWRIALPGIFKYVRISPAMSTRETVSLLLKLEKKL